MNRRSPHEIPEFVADALRVTTDRSISEPDDVGELLASVAIGEGKLVPAHSLRRRLLSSATTGVLRYAPFFEKVGTLFDVERPGVARMFEKAQRADEWTPGPHPSIALLHLESGAAVAGADVGFVRMPAGFFWPRHRHLGRESVLILEGGYDDSDGKCYRAGDLHEMHPGTAHAFTVFKSSPLLLAVLLYEGIEMV